MPLSQLYPVPERILVFGPAGSAKSTGWLNIAKFCALSGSNAQFYVLNTDDAIPRMMINYPSIQDRVHLTQGYDWPDFVTFGKNVAKLARPHDWVVVDFIGDAWPAVTEDFVQQVHGKDVGDYFLWQRKADEKALDGWKDYGGVINPRYFGWIKPLVFKGRYNLYATAKGDALSSDKKPTESSAVRNLFLPYGVKPVGQKELPFQFHTVLLAGKTQMAGKPAQYTLTTVKDRERSELVGQVVSNFAIDYLINVAGWQM